MTTIPTTDALENEPETLSFTSDTTVNPDTMTLTCIECDESVTFWNPTAERVDWYERSHRCGGSYWQDNGERDCGTDERTDVETERDIDARLDRITDTIREIRLEVMPLLAERLVLLLARTEGTAVPTPDECACHWADRPNHDELLKWLRCESPADAVDLIEQGATWHELHDGGDEIPPADWTDFALEHNLPDAPLSARAVRFAAEASRKYRKLAGE